MNIENASKGEWRTSIKGKPEEIYEIAVVNTAFTHGFISYGWECEHKIIISGSGGSCNYKIPKEIFTDLVNVANKWARFLSNRTNQQSLAE